MAIVKTAELEGDALDWAVSKCEEKEHLFDGHEVGRLHYSTDWSEGGPIIQREKINLQFCRDFRAKDHGLYIHAEIDTHLYHGYWWGDHEQPLVAAMRCFVEKKFGPSIEVPDELMQTKKPSSSLSF